MRAFFVQQVNKIVWFNVLHVCSNIIIMSDAVSNWNLKFRWFECWFKGSTSCIMIINNLFYWLFVWSKMSCLLWIGEYHSILFCALIVHIICICDFHTCSHVNSTLRHKTLGLFADLRFSLISNYDFYFDAYEHQKL